TRRHLRRAEHGGSRCAENARLLGADLLDGLPQPVAMVEADRADHRRVRIDEIRGIESAAETHLEQRELDAPLRKEKERRQRVVFEEGEAGAAARRLDALERAD